MFKNSFHDLHHANALCDGAIACILRPLSLKKSPIKMYLLFKKKKTIFMPASLIANGMEWMVDL